MATKTLNVRQKQKYDTSTNWTTNNPILLVGEIGVESDTQKVKVGNGTDNWNTLSYISGTEGTKVKVDGNIVKEWDADINLNTKANTNASNINTNDYRTKLDINNVNNTSDAQKSYTHKHHGDEITFNLSGNTAGSVDLIDIPKIDKYRANKTAFLPADNIKIERSNDAGITWVEDTECDKEALFNLSGQAFYFTPGASPTLNDYFRVTISAKENCYFTLNQLYFIYDSSGYGCKYDIELSKQKTPNDFYYIKQNLICNGWSGPNTCNFSFVFGDYSVKRYIESVRITFKPTSIYEGGHPSVYDMRFFGGKYWKSISNMAETDRMYKIQPSNTQNVSFPNKVYVNNSFDDIDRLVYKAELDEKANKNADNIDVQAFKDKLNIPEGSVIYQELGQNTNGGISQKVVTDNLNLKVDKIDGKNLSTNDFTNEDKNLLTNSASKTYVDTNFVNKTGNSTIDGDITLKDPNSQAGIYLHKDGRATFQSSVGQSKRFLFMPDGYNNNNIPTIAFDNNGKIMNLIDPTNDNDAANKHYVDNKTYTSLINKPKLNSDNSLSQPVNASEEIDGTINLHKISKTGKFSDLVDKTEASQTVGGIIKIAEQQDIIDGINNTKAITPKQLKEVVNTIHSFEILNKAVVNATESDVQVVATQYVQTEYGRAPKTNDCIIITLTDKNNDKVLYIYSEISNLWINAGINSIDLTDYLKKNDCVNDVISTDTLKPLAANQGRVLNEKINQNIENTNTKLDKMTDQTYFPVAYVKQTDGTQLGVGLLITPESWSIPLRDANGKAQISTPITEDSPKTIANKEYVDNGLSSKANQNETYTKTQVNDMIGAIASIHFEVYQTRPETGTANIIYLIPNSSSGENIYDEYIYINSKWELIGSTEIDLSNYYNKNEVDTKLSDKANQNELNATNQTVTQHTSNIEMNAIAITNLQTDRAKVDASNLNESNITSWKNKLDIKESDNSKKNIIPQLKNTWLEYEWYGDFQNISGNLVWTDGQYLYFDNSSTHKYMHRFSDTWVDNTSINFNFFGADVWKDYYGNIHCDGIGSIHKMFNPKNWTWTDVTWTGLIGFDGKYVWTDGVDIYYSKGTEQYRLEHDNTHTWEVMTWNGLTKFDGSFIWTDGVDIYYSQGTNQYRLEHDNTHTWEVMTWNGLTSFNGNFVWTDGVDIYYCNYSVQYRLKHDNTHTWEVMTWNGIDGFDGRYVWTNGVDIYYSEGSIQKILGGKISKLCKT